MNTFSTHRLTAYLVCLLITCLPVSAMACPKDDRGFGVYVDQDLFALGINEDRDYTTGIAVECFWNRKDDHFMDVPALWLGQQLGVFDGYSDVERSYMLGNITYTPDNLSESAPILDDRPYSSLIYLSNKHVYANKKDRSAIGIDMKLGLLGTSISRDVQRFLHQQWRNTTGDSDPVDPKGWGNQISDGGEPTVGLRLTYTKAIKQLSSKNWDVAGTASVSVGYQTSASLGMSARAGRIDSQVWTLPYSPINRGNFLPSLSGDEWYVWAAYRVHVIGYDALLQGQFRDSKVTFDSDDVRDVVHDAGIGLTLSYKPVQVTFSINGKSSELNTGTADRDHVWGGVYFIWR